LEVDPIEHARKMIAHIDKKRRALGIDRAREKILVDLSARRDLETA
jgi:carbon-monoxide dehydrogenase catalytic subunit